jgi:CheY-like chemotaxis protein
MAHILFIDDDPVTLNMLCKAAGLDGHRTSSATSGADALTRVAENKPDLILVDWMMPDMDGISFIRALRETPESDPIPVIVLTAGFELDTAERAIEAGAQGYLNKPISMETLRKVIGEYTNG